MASTDATDSKPISRSTFSRSVRTRSNISSAERVWPIFPNAMGILQSSGYTLFPLNGGWRLVGEIAEYPGNAFDCHQFLHEACQQVRRKTNGARGQAVYGIDGPQHNGIGKLGSAQRN